VNIRGSSSCLDCYSIVDRFTGLISAAGLGFIPNKLSPDSVIFISFIGGVLAASWASIWS